MVAGQIPLRSRDCLFFAHCWYTWEDSLYLCNYYCEIPENQKSTCFDSNLDNKKHPPWIENGNKADVLVITSCPTRLLKSFVFLPTWKNAQKNSLKNEAKWAEMRVKIKKLCISSAQVDFDNMILKISYFGNAQNIL